MNNRKDYFSLTNCFGCGLNMGELLQGDPLKHELSMVLFIALDKKHTMSQTSWPNLTDTQKF